MARYIEGLERYRARRLSCEEAAELLGVSERHFRRLRDRYEADGAEGLIDRRRGRVSGRRAPVDQIEFVIEQYRTRYWDFTVKHFHEALQAEHVSAIPGPRRYCRAAAWCARRPSARRIARRDRGGHCRG